MSMDEDDKISQLPQHILHHILCFLSQKKAVQTSVLSKSWRYLGSTRPKVELRKHWLQKHEKTYTAAMDKTLQRYHDQKLSIQQFVVEMYGSLDSETRWLLEKWVPIVVTNMGTKVLNITLNGFVLPSAVFQAECLEELYLCRCMLSRIESAEKLSLKRLQKLSLIRVYIDDETFQKVMSSCPSIQYLVMYWCMGLRTIHVNNNNNLKHFEFKLDSSNYRDCSIEIGHVPSLETIKVDGCSNWFDHHRLCFTHLKSLCLTSVRLSTTKSFDIFSSNFPILEDLTLDDNSYGFDEFKLSSRSIKRLAITKSREPIKATIDAPNILCFQYSSCFLQSSISFTSTCSHEWESNIYLYEFPGYVYNDDGRGGSSSWLYKLNELAKAFSQSKISVHISQCFEIWKLNETVLVEDSICTNLLAVEQLILDSDDSSSLSLPALTKCLFRIFRPRYIVECHLFDKYDPKPRVESLSKILLEERGRGNQFWLQDLEDMVMEGTGAEEECRPVRTNQNRKLLKIRFRLKWRETEMSLTPNT